MGDVCKGELFIMLLCFLLSGVFVFFLGCVCGIW